MDEGAVSVERSETAGSLPFRCIRCHRRVGPREFRCACGGLLEVSLDDRAVEVTRSLFEGRRDGPWPFASGVWRFREMVHPGILQRVTRGEGNTPLLQHPRLTEFTGVSRLTVKHEGENPTGSFKDRGMTVAVSEAVRLGVPEVSCASTGNTSSSLASYAAFARLTCTVYIPRGQVAPAKLAQTVAYGARVIEIDGNFDAALSAAERNAAHGQSYLVNSLNPWRIEGQKTIILEMLAQRGWEPPDWIALPAGNLGNASAFGKALVEAKRFGLIDRLPRLLLVQAEGAAPFYRLWKSGANELTPEPNPTTEASAIRIGNPVSWPKALQSLRACGGGVEVVSDREIFSAKREIDHSGIGCEPASAASIAGVKRWVEAGRIARDAERRRRLDWPPPQACGEWLRLPAPPVERPSANAGTLRSSAGPDQAPLLVVEHLHMGMVRLSRIP